MKRMLGLLLSMLMLAWEPVSATTLRVANIGDVQSMDPHSLHESLQLSFLGNVYEPLVNRGKDMGLVPGLARQWTQTSPTVWRFELRRGVRFHDGTPFDADDVLFSFMRASGDGSDMKGQTAPILQVRKVDDYTVDVETVAPLPILPDMLTVLYMMSRKWCEQIEAQKPADRRKNIENAATFQANGTAPFRLKERQPGLRTVLVRNDNYWGNVESNIDEVVYMPIASDATRVAALLSGEVDVIEPVPLQDIPRIDSNASLKVMRGPELRTLFLGMDQKRDELLYSSVEGRNPFKDRRVRQAFYQAIDIEAIRSRVMRGASTPTALMVAPGVRGFQPDMNQRLPFDPKAAMALLAQAGYPNGFNVTLNCPNDRYVNDAAICQAVAANLARIGVRVSVQLEPKVIYQPRVLRRETSFYLLGWTPSTADTHDVLYHIVNSPGDKGQGQFNLGWYSNPRLDELTAQIQTEMDVHKRDRLIRAAFKIHQDDIGHIPLHQQPLLWGMKQGVSMVQLPNDRMFFKWVTMK